MQETLAAAMPKIMAALGQFANDGEIKVQPQRWSYRDRTALGQGSKSCGPDCNGGPVEMSIYLSVNVVCCTSWHLEIVLSVV